MKYLAKCGFSQSYTYFTWRNTKAELTAYMEDLTRGDAREYLRPNFFANTPDILPEYLQTGGRPAFQIRLVLAAMLAGNYGIYGPPFELCVADAVPGSEEYLDSEKYEIRSWDLEAPHSLRPWITRVNEIRKENPALRHAERLTVVPTDDDAIFAFVRSTPDLENVLLVVVNLDPYHARAGWLDLDLAALKIDATQSFQMQDLLGGGRFLWQGPRSYVALDPNVLPAHILRLRRRVRTEQDFDYFL
jgi:starch synthase (maltosyl-transferring)